MENDNEILRDPPEGGIEGKDFIFVTEQEVALANRVNRELELSPALREEFMRFMADLSIDELVKYSHPTKLACVFELWRVMKNLRATALEKRMREIKSLTLKANSVQATELVRLHQDLKKQKDGPLERIREVPAP